MSLGTPVGAFDTDGLPVTISDGCGTSVGATVVTVVGIGIVVGVSVTGTSVGDSGCCVGATGLVVGNDIEGTGVTNPSVGDGEMAGGTIWSASTITAMSLIIARMQTLRHSKILSCPTHLMLCSSNPTLFRSLRRRFGMGLCR